MQENNFFIFTETSSVPHIPVTPCDGLASQATQGKLHINGMETYRVKCKQLSLNSLICEKTQ